MRCLRPLLDFNFFCSILVVIAIYQILDATADYRAFASARLFPGRSLARLVVLALIEAYLLVRFLLRDYLGHAEPRLIAGVMGSFGLIVILIVVPLATSLYGGDPFTWRSLGVLYVSASHVLYAFLGRPDA